MPEHKNVSLYQQQKASKPPVEDMIDEYLDGKMKKLALDLAAHFRANKMKPAWCLTNQWRAVYKAKNICRITLYPGHLPAPPEIRATWVVTAYLMHLQDYEETVIREDMQRFVWDNVVYCVHKPIDSPPPVESRRTHGLGLPCNHWNCAPGNNITICGKELTNICRNTNRQYFWCHDPGEATISAIKRLLELEQKARAENDASFRKRK